MTFGFSDYYFYLTVGKYGITFGLWYLMLSIVGSPGKVFGTEKVQACDFNFHCELFQKQYVDQIEEW